MPALLILLLSNSYSVQLALSNRKKKAVDFGVVHTLAFSWNKMKGEKLGVFIAHMSVLFLLRENQNKYLQLKSNKRLPRDSNRKGEKVPHPQ